MSLPYALEDDDSDLTPTTYDDPRADDVEAYRERHAPRDICAECGSDLTDDDRHYQSCSQTPDVGP